MIEFFWNMLKSCIALIDGAVKEYFTFDTVSFLKTIWSWKIRNSLNFLNFLNNKHPNIKFTTEKQVNHSIVFCDLFISGIHDQNLILQTYHKLTYTRFLLNFKTFISFSYNISWIQCLIDRWFKISNNCNSIHNDIENIKSNLIHYSKSTRSLKSTLNIRSLVTKTN